MKKIVNFRPILICAVCLCLGILSAYLFCLSKITEFAILVSVVAVSFILAVIFALKRAKLSKARFIFVFVFIVIFALGFGLFSLQYNNFNSETLARENLTFSGKVVEIREGEKSVGVILDNVKVKERDDKMLNNRVEIYLSLGSNVGVGDNVSFTATLSERSSIYDGRFNVNSLLDRIKFSAFVNDKNIVIKDGSPDLFSQIKLFFKDVMENSMGENEYPVAYAMLFGNSDYIDTEQ